MSTPILRAVFARFLCRLRKISHFLTLHDFAYPKRNALILKREFLWLIIFRLFVIIIFMTILRYGAR